MRKIKTFDEAMFLMENDISIYCQNQDGQYFVPQVISNMRQLIGDGNLFCDLDFGCWTEDDIKWLYWNEYYLTLRTIAPDNSQPAYAMQNAIGKTYLVCTEPGKYELAFYKRGNRDMSNPDFVKVDTADSIGNFIKPFDE